MSFISPTLSGLAPVNQAELPSNIRNSNGAAKQAYTEALAFEQMLMGELAQQLSQTTSGGSDSTDGSSGGLLGSDPSASAFSSLMPQALTSSVMSGGGTGIAEEIAQSLDPALRSGAAAPSSTSNSTTGGATL